MNTPLFSHLQRPSQPCLRLCILTLAVGVCGTVRSEDPTQLPSLATTVIPHQYPKSFRDLGEIVRFGRGGNSAKFVPIDKPQDMEARAAVEAAARKWLVAHCPPSWEKQLSVSTIEVSESGNSSYHLTFLPEYCHVPIEQKNSVKVDNGVVTYAFLQVNRFAATNRADQKILPRSTAYRKLSAQIAAIGKPVEFSEKDLTLIYRQHGVLVEGKARLQFSPVWIDPHDYVYINAHTGECALND